MKKLWAALLLIAVLLGLLNAAAVAEVMENIQIDKILYYDSGCLKEFTMTYTVESGKAAADVRVAAHVQKFSDTKVGSHPYGDLRDNGVYADTHNYPDWAPKPADCGFISWASTEFKRPIWYAPTEPVTIRFDDHVIDCNIGKTYYMYAWAKYGGNTYPDAFVTSFKTGGGKIESEAIKDDGVTPSNPANDPSNIPPKDPSNAAQDIPSTVNLPKTGDDSQMLLWLALGLLAGAGLLALTRRRAAGR